MKPDKFLKTLDKRAAEKAQQTLDQQHQALAVQNAQAIVETIGAATKALIAFQKNHVPSVAVKMPDMQPIVKALEAVKAEVTNTKPDDSKTVAAINKLAAAVGKLPTKFPEPVAVEEVTVKNQPDYTPEFEKLNASIQSIDAKTTVTVPKNDYTPLIQPLNDVLEAIKKIKLPEVPQTDLTPLLEATNSVQDAITSLRFPVPNYILPYKSSDGKDTQVTLNSDGSLPITASISTGGLATSAIQTNGTQITQIQGSGGGVATVTGGKLDVNATASLAGSAIPVSGATTGVGVAILDGSGNQISSFGGGTQYTDGGTPPTHAIGSVPVYDSGGTWKSVSTANKLPVATGLTQPTTPSDTQPISAASLPLPTGAATGAKQDTGNTSVASIDTKTPALGQALAAASVPVVLPAAQITTLTPPAAITGFATSAKQDIGNTSLASIDGKITVVNTGAVVVSSSALPTGAATAAKQPALGTAGTASADILTVQGKALMTPLLTDGSGVTQPVSGTFWQATQPVSLASVPSHAVTNAGTFAVQATEADGANVTLGSKADAKSAATDTTAVTVMQVLKQISASVQAPPSQAVTNAGTFAVQAAATLAAETTKVIGTVNVAAAQTIGVTQATGTNLHAVVDSGTITAVTAITNQVDTNIKQVAGANTLAGNGASGTGAQRVTIASDSTGQVAPAANASATGTSIYNNTALSSTKQAVNASAGNLYGYHLYNPNSVVIYVQMWNVASASVTVGTTAPTAVIAVPPLGWADAPPAGPPISFATALTIAATTTSTGLTAPTTALLCNIWYK